MLKFNMGCGRRQLPGYVNVDAFPGCEPDVVYDLEQTPWPWEDDCAEEVRFIHSLEHLGGEPRVFLAIVQELYRICAPDGRVVIHVPHPRSDVFAHDPTHVRPIYPDTLRMFDRQLNDSWAAQGGANTPLAHMTGVDFELIRVKVQLSEAYFQALQEGRITTEEVQSDLRSRWNVARGFELTLRARKG